DELARLVELGLQHEQQHQELILTDVQHLLWHNPMRPAYRSPAAYNSAELDETDPATADHDTAEHSRGRPDRPLPRGASPSSLHWLTFDAGVVEVGHRGKGFHFDNELPRHRQFLEPYALASRLVTNAEYQAF